MRDIFRVAKKTIYDTGNAISKGGVIFVILYIVVKVLFNFLNDVAGKIPIAGFFIIYLLEILQYTIYARGLNDVTLTDKIRTSNFLINFGSYFYNIMNTYFVIYVLRIVVGMFTNNYILRYGYTPNYMATLAFIIEHIMFSAIFEAVYIDHVGGIAAFKQNFKFLKENYLPWFILNIPYILMQYILTLYPMDIINENLLLSVGILVIPPFYLIFRGKMYLYLSTTNKRKRAFENEFEKVNKTRTK